jgi:hypothetical protein
MANYTQAVQDTASEQAKQCCLACMFLIGTDKARYGDMIAEIQNDFQKNINSYPTTMTGAYALIVNWIPKFVLCARAPAGKLVCPGRQHRMMGMRKGGRAAQ